MNNIMKLRKASYLPFLAILLLVFVPMLQALPAPSFSSETTHLNRTNSLERRDCKAIADKPGEYDCDMNAPTLSQIISHMKDPAYSGTVTDESRSVFYANLNRPGFSSEPQRYLPWIVSWLKQPSNNIDKYYTVFDVTPSWYRAQTAGIVNNGPAIQKQMDTKLNLRVTFAYCYFEALALAAIHPTAYLFTKDGQEPSVTSIWKKIEFPALTRNPQIKEIYRVDPRPPTAANGEGFGRKGPEEL